MDLRDFKSSIREQMKFAIKKNDAVLYQYIIDPTVKLTVRENRVWVENIEKEKKELLIDKDVQDILSYYLFLDVDLGENGKSFVNIR